MVRLYVNYRLLMVAYRHIMDEIDRVISSPEAIILTGMRRVGKTTLLRYFFDRTDDKNKVFIDCENIINRRYFDDDNYERIKKHLEFLGIDFNKKAYIFIDEIQFVKNLPSIAKYFIDHYAVKFFLTGSASFYLRNLFTESLAGRKVIFEVFPLSFREFLGFKQITFNIPKDAKEVTQEIHDTLAPLYDEYMYYGGFPHVVLQPNVELKKTAIEDIFNSYFQLEVIQLGDFRKNETIRDMMLLLMQSVGSKIDIQKISRDIGVSRQTVYDYLAFLEGTYFITTTKPLSQGKGSEIRKTPKVYICDSGVVNHFVKVGEGHLFENTVFQSLRVKGEVNYYQRKSGVEIDFVVNKSTAYEVKQSPSQIDIKRLKALCSDLKIGEYKVVSKKYCKDAEDIIYGFMF